jgi:hypothetical protein
VRTPVETGWRLRVQLDVAHLVDDQQRAADEFGLQGAAAVGGGQPVDPLAGGGEQDSMPAGQARMTMPVARGGLPIPGGPRNTTLSLAVTVSVASIAQVAQHLLSQREQRSGRFGGPQGGFELSRAAIRTAQK